MKSFANMRGHLFLIAVLLFFTSCEEKDKTGSNPAPTENNAVMRLSLLYDGSKIPPDSVITNNLGHRFFIDHVILVFSDFNLLEGADTLVTGSDPFVLSSDMTDNAIVRIPTDGYSARYSLRIGLDSSASADIATNGIPSGSELKEVPVLRSTGDGIDHAIIEGRLFDPSDPTDTVGSIPLSYRLGTTELNRIYTSLQKNFSVQGDRKVSIVVQVDLGPALEDLDMVNRPMVVTDPQNLVDYNLATQMVNNIVIELF